MGVRSWPDPVQVFGQEWGIDENAIQALQALPGLQQQDIMKRFSPPPSVRSTSVSLVAFIRNNAPPETKQPIAPPEPAHRNTCNGLSLESPCHASHRVFHQTGPKQPKRFKPSARHQQSCKSPKHIRRLQTMRPTQIAWHAADCCVYASANRK